MTEKNIMELKFSADTFNESFARICVAAFCVQLVPTVDELEDIKTAVSEAITNAIVHAYKYNNGVITMRCELLGNNVSISISDNGAGIDNIEQARQPFFTTIPSDERSGMGFTVMESFMDNVVVKKNRNGGTTVVLSKAISPKELKSAG